MRAIEQRQEQGRHATATREDMRRGRRTEGSEARSPVARADHPQPQRDGGDGTELMSCNDHEAPRLQVLREGSSSRMAP